MYPYASYNDCCIVHSTSTLTFAPCPYGGCHRHQFTVVVFSLSNWHKYSTCTRGGFTHCNLRWWCFSFHPLAQIPYLRSSNLHCVVVVFWWWRWGVFLVVVVVVKCISISTPCIMHMGTTTMHVVSMCKLHVVAAPAPTCADGCWCPVPLTFSNLRWWCFSFQQLAQTLTLHLWW